MAQAPDIESVLRERRLFKPPKKFSQTAHITSLAHYRKLAKQAEKNPEKFWASIAKELHWDRPWKKTLVWKPPFAQWFVGGKLNVSTNCLDRHLTTWRRNKAALIWEGEPGESRILTYQQLHHEVCKFANVLKKLGVGRGDRVCIYLPMITEAVIAMLAGNQKGAAHSVVVGGFSADALKDRIQDAGARLLVTADGGWRRG